MAVARCGPVNGRGAVMTEGVTARAGDRMAGYLLEAQVGAGGMAVVFRARDERLGRLVALKLLAPGLAADEAFRQRFIRESRAAAAVDHPNVIPVYEAGEAAGVLFIAMRYVHGGDVRTVLDQDGPLPAARAWAIIRQVAAALDCAHGQGLVHRDVKPANILLDSGTGTAGPGPGGPAEHVYLSDFGISKQPAGTSPPPAAASSLTVAGEFVGTLDYIAPEQIDGRPLDGRADLYSLGCAAYELLGGAPPFRPAQGLALVRAQLSQPPPPLTALRPDLPAVIDQVLAGAMAKAPGDRYPACGQFAADLGRALGLLPGVPAPRAPAHRPRPGAATEAWPGVLAGAAGLAAAGATATGAAVTAGMMAAGAGGVPAAGVARAAAPRPGVIPGGPLTPLLGEPGRPGRRGWPSAPPPDGAGGAGWPRQPLQYQSPQYQSPQHPSAQPESPRRVPRRSRAVVQAGVAAVAVVLAAGVVGAILIGRGTAAPDPAGVSAAAVSVQAAGINSLLSSGTGTNAQLSGALAEADDCADVAGSVSELTQIRDQRRSEFEQARTAAVSLLPGGSRLKLDLTRALWYSLLADDAYLTWAARQGQGPCRDGSEPLLADLNREATSFKDQFTQLWNPIASRHELPQRSLTSM